MKGVQLQCGCGSTTISPHKVQLLSGWEEEGTLVETVLKTNLPNEDPTTMVAQRKIDHQDEERASAELKGMRCRIVVSYHCFECGSWGNKLDITEDVDNAVGTCVSWIPLAKKKTKK